MHSRPFKSLGKHSVVYGLSNALVASASLLMLPLLTHSLSPAQYGTLELLVVCGAALGILLQLGFGSALFKFALQDADLERDRSVVISSAYYAVATVSILVTSVLVYFAPEVSRSLLGSEKNATLVGWFLVKVSLDTIGVVPLARLRMLEASRTYAAINASRIFVSLAFIGIAIYGFNSGLSGIVIAMALESLGFAIVASVTAGPDLVHGISSRALHDMLAFGLPLIPFAFALTVLAVGDRYLLRAFGDLELIGRYAVGYKIAAALAIPTRAFQIAWPTMLFSMANAPNGNQFYSKLLTYFVAILGFCGVVVSTFARELIRFLAGTSYAGGYVIVPVLVFAQIALGTFYVTAVGTNLTGKTYWQSLSAGLGVAAFGVAGLALVPRFGIMGAAFANAVGYATLAATSCFFSVRLRPVRYEWRAIATLALVTASLVVVGSTLRTGLLALDVAIQLAVVSAYPLLVYASGVLSPTDRAAVRRLALRASTRLLLRPDALLQPPDSIRRVLVYGGMGIGNLIMFSPALRALRSQLRNAHITVLMVENGADQVIAGSGLVDEILFVPRGRLARLRFAFRVRRRAYDAVIVSFQGDDFKLITLLSGAPCRVGHVTSPGWSGRADFLYNIPVQMDENEHEVDRKLRLVRALGLDAPNSLPVFHVRDVDREAAAAFLRDRAVVDDDRLIAVPIDVSRAQEWKQWHPERLALVCNELHRRHGAKAVLMGAPNRVKEVDGFRSLLDFEPIVALGQVTLKETAAILERCALTICADSGLMHVSAAVGTPVLAIYGPTDYRRTSPLRYGPQHRIVRKPVECSPCFRMEGDATVLGCPHHKCLGLITADDVVRAAEELMGINDRQSPPVSAATATAR